MTEGSGETLECPVCGYETVVWDPHDVYHCPECDEDAGHGLRQIIEQVPSGPPILVPPDDDPVIDVTTRGEVVFCPHCEEVIEDYEQPTDDERIVELSPCGHRVRANGLGSFIGM